jgi:hypothetical protein
MLNEQSFGSKSANVISHLVRLGGSVADWTHIDLSFNKLGLNLAPIISGLKHN